MFVFNRNENGFAFEADYTTAPSNSAVCCHLVPGSLARVLPQFLTKRRTSGVIISAEHHIPHAADQLSVSA
jgi:hypothetical protein